MSVSNMLSNNQLDQDYVIAYATAPGGVKTVIRNGEMARTRQIALANKLIKDPLMAKVGQRLATEADRCYQRMVRQVIAKDWNALLGNKYTR